MPQNDGVHGQIDILRRKRTALALAGAGGWAKKRRGQGTKGGARGRRGRPEGEGRRGARGKGRWGQVEKGLLPRAVAFTFRMGH